MRFSNELIVDIFNLKPTAGEVGIEVEMEGERLPQEEVVSWACTHDPSLRGNSVEYVLRKPVPRNNVGKVLENLQAAFTATKAVLEPSDRCGVHVHVNCQQLTHDQTVRFIVLYLILEEIMVKYCGEDREGNLFCLRIKDAEYLIAQLNDMMISNSSLRNYQGDVLRYSSLNIISLRKYGSVEFRAMRTHKHVMEIATWVDLLLRIKDASLRYSSIHDMVEGISREGGLRFMESIFEDKTELLYCSNIDKIIMAGVRRVQDIAYNQPVIEMGRYRMSLSHKELADYYQNMEISADKVGKPDISKEAIRREHGEPHPGNYFEDPDNAYFWSIRDMEWEHGPLAPLSPDEQEWYAKRRERVEAQWEQWDKKKNTKAMG